MNKNLNSAAQLGLVSTGTAAIVKGDITVLLTYPVVVAVIWGVTEFVGWVYDRLVPSSKAELAPDAKPLSDADRRRTAYHEAGHLVVGGAVGLVASIQSATIVPSPGCRGHVARRDEGTEPYLTKKGYGDQIAFFLGGRVAEYLVLAGADNGSRSDLRQASVYATHMLEVAGFGSGKLAYLQLDEGETVSDDMLAMLEGQKREEIQAQAVRAKEILETNRDLLDEIAAKLLEVETIEGADLDQFLARVKQPS